jgi:hypothetical protein
MSAIYLNEKYKDLLEVSKKNTSSYQNGTPFPNISFDNFFKPEYLDKVLLEFPDLSSIQNSKKYDNSKEIKFTGKGELYFGDETKKFMHFLNSEPFLNFLQVLTGIEEPLIADPYFIGGGQHEIKKGGLLKIHADFNKHPKLGLDRRINLLVYLNKDWKDEYGGNFELWGENMKKCEKKFLPIFNRIAIFNTTDFSYHGHPDPLACPEERSRKSLALYYYTNGRPQSETNNGLEDHSTLFKARLDNKEDKAVFDKNNSIKNMIKGFVPPHVLKIVKIFIRKK